MRTNFRFLPGLLPFVVLLCGGSLIRGQDLESSRQVQVRGNATDHSTRVTFTLGVNDDPAARIMNGSVDSTGNFTMPVKLFPGNNTINVQGDTNEEEHTVTINVQSPAIRVELDWAGQHQDYDLYVNSVYYGNTEAEGGKLDRDWIGNNNSYQDPAVENITFASADAGLYHVFVNYYLPHTQDADGHEVTDPNTGETVPNPLPTTVKVFVNEQQVYTATNTIQKPERGISDGKGTWAVCTLVVHSGTESGGFQVDGNGYRDIVPQKTILSRIEPRTPFSVNQVTAPSSDNIIFFPVGKSIQLHANGSINVGTDNEQSGIDIIGKFQSGDSSVADVDDLGVVTGLTPGVVTISTYGGSQDDSGTQTQAVQPNASTPTAKVVAPTKVTFGKNGTNNGFDPGPNPPWILVPIGGTGTADNTVIEPAAATASKVGFSTFNTNATVAPAVASSSPVTVTVTGSAAGQSTIQAKLRASDGSLGDELGAMVAAIKPKLQRRLVIHQVLLPGQAAMANLPTNADLEQYMNDVWEKQCNVHFTVQRSDVQVNYDTIAPADQKLQINPGDALSQEEAAVANAVASANPAPPPSDIDIYFVYDVTSTRPNTAGWCHGPLNKAFLKIGAGAATTYVKFACAHESGHTVLMGGLHDLTRVDRAMNTDPYPSGKGDITKRLMYHDNDAGTPTFLNKTEWNIVNKVQ